MKNRKGMLLVGRLKVSTIAKASKASKASKVSRVSKVSKVSILFALPYKFWQGAGATGN